MRKTFFAITCGALALLTSSAMAQDRYYGRDDHYGDRYERRDDRRDGGRWGGGPWGGPWGGPGGGGVVLFEHDGFRGEARVLRGDAPDLARLGFNDRVSSMRISRGVWEFCEHAYYEGKCWTYDYDMASLPRKQNDRYSSVRRVR